MAAKGAAALRAEQSSRKGGTVVHKVDYNP